MSDVIESNAHASANANPNANPDAEARRNAYNAAFHELGLDWFWDSGCAMPDSADERACVHAYLAQHRPHLLTAYDADFLVDAILAAKARCAPEIFES